MASRSYIIVYYLCSCFVWVTITIVILLTPSPLWIRFPIIFVFFTIIPGLCIIPVFQVTDSVIMHIILAITLSLSIDGFFVGLNLYLIPWSPTFMVLSILGVSLLGIIGQTLRLSSLKSF
jgi:hypothetical protein